MESNTLICLIHVEYSYMSNTINPPLCAMSLRSILRTEGGPDKDPSGLMSNTVGAESGLKPRERTGYRSDSDSPTPLPLSVPLDLPCI